MVPLVKTQCSGNCTIFYEDPHPHPQPHANLLNCIQRNKKDADRANASAPTVSVKSFARKKVDRQLLGMGDFDSDGYDRFSNWFISGSFVFEPGYLRMEGPPEADRLLLVTFPCFLLLPKKKRQKTTTEENPRPHFRGFAGFYPYALAL